MIAFSTDVSVAGQGVYLLSFLIEGYVDRIVQYAVSTGKRSFAVMAPKATTAMSLPPGFNRMRRASAPKSS